MASRWAMRFSISSMTSPRAVSSCVACLDGRKVRFKGLGVKVSNSTEGPNDIPPGVVAVASEDGDIISKVDEVHKWLHGKLGVDIDILRSLPGDAARLTPVHITLESHEQG